jgi:hypothetical protein
MLALKKNRVLSLNRMDQLSKQLDVARCDFEQSDLDLKRIRLQLKHMAQEEERRIKREQVIDLTSDEDPLKPERTLTTDDGEEYDADSVGYMIEEVVL